ncbi:NAD(P)/FAD-dependent oxidoreductase [bacterium]|nr:NAD(P)/FAD-dependent oxidoreductase [bacterium]
MKSYNFVILGGGIVAGYAAQQMVEDGLMAHQLCIISADDRPPYERPALSKDFLEGESSVDDILINEDGFYAEHGIDLRLNTRVTGVDLGKKLLHTDDGDHIGFEKLLIATGSKVRTFDLPGADLGNIFYLRWLDDAKMIRNIAQQAERGVVIGSGFIGLEVSSVLAQHNVNTFLVFPESSLMEGFFTAEMADYFEEYYRARGIKFVANETVTGFSGDRQVESVKLTSERGIAAELVVAGIGVEPATDLFRETGLEIDDGIVVNEYLETNIDDVYAAGDVTRYWDLLYDKYRHIEHWDNAAEQGKTAAQNMMGKAEAFVKVPYFFSDEFDLSWEFWGDTDGADEIIHRGDVSSGSFSTWWLKDGKLIAAFVMDRPNEERELAPQWIRSKEPIPTQRLRDASVSLPVGM